MNSWKPITRREMLLALVPGIAVTSCARKKFERRRAGQPLELIVCGWDEVFILPIGKEMEPAPRKVWSWRAVDCPDIPEGMKRAFRTTDDCKPVEGGRKILISSSSGAIALVERANGRALFYASVPNAHSVEMLPGGRIAAASSVSKEPPGNRLIIFDIASRRELASDTLYSAHGVVWDEERQVLWALGGSRLRAYRLLEEGNGRLGLKVEFEAELPDTNGHDLQPLHGTRHLFISTGRHCWLFDRNTRKFRPHDVLANVEDVKSFSLHPSTGRIAYIQAEGKNWWSERIHFLNPRAELRLPGERLYKARYVLNS